VRGHCLRLTSNSYRDAVVRSFSGNFKAIGIEETISRGWDMVKERCKGTALNSFFGDFICGHEVPQDHLLKKVHEEVDRIGSGVNLSRITKGK